jgi:hypothetical protein
MAELERTLRQLAPEVDWPATPDVAGRLELTPRRRQRRLLAAVAVAVLALAIAFAVPPARSAILRLLHLGGVTVVRVDTLPPAQQRPLSAGLGAPVSDADARFVLGRQFRLPPAARGTQLYELSNVVSALLAAPEPLLLSELSGTGLMKKLAAGGTSIEDVEIEPGVHGFWLSGAEHVFFGPQAPPRLAGNVLIWERDGLTLRLEGKRLTRAAAIRLAREIDGTQAG